MIHTIIIEDEYSGQQLMKSILQNNFPNIQVDGFATHVQDAVDLIKNTQPKLVIIDVQLQDGTGLQVIEQFPEPRPFELVFVTAYSEFAIHAIKRNAVDYILKPISISEFISGIEKAIKRINTKLLFPTNHTIPIAVSHGIEFIPANQIVFLEAEGSFTQVITKSGKLHSTRSLGEYLETLPKNVFYRTHRSFIVNLKQIIQVKKSRGGMIVLNYGYTIPISQRKIKEFMNKVNTTINGADL